MLTWNKDLMSSNMPHLPFPFRLPLESPHFKPTLFPKPKSTPHPSKHAHIIKAHLHPTIQSADHLKSIITTHANSNSPIKALLLYSHMRTLAPTTITNFFIPSFLKAAGRLSCLILGKEIHSFVTKFGLLDHDIFIQNALIQMYFYCGSPFLARQLFDKMPHRDVVSWSTMIGCFGHFRLFGDALRVIRDMHLSSVRPSGVALMNMVSVAADMEALDIGREIHAYVVRNSDCVSAPVESALVHMYVKCGSILPAQQIFDRMVGKSVISWTAMVAGYVRYRRCGEALRLLNEMKSVGVFANEITVLSLALECGGIGELNFGKWLHAYVLRYGFEMSVVLATALIDMYGKCGAVDYARALFDRLDKKDVKTWTALISGYALVGRLEQAFEQFVQMREAKIEPNEITVVNILKLSAEKGALDCGKCIHGFITKKGIECDAILVTALVDMYAKCGDIDWSYRMFNGASNRDICMWNAMMSGFAMHGLVKQVLDLLHGMEEAGFKPNDVTFIAVLHACSHAGLVAEGQWHFGRMVQKFGLVPKVEHYGCMVDLLGRTGLLEEAYVFIKNMPIKPNVIVWGALLAACKLHRNVKLGELAAKQLLKLEPNNCGYNVLMSNIYAGASRWNDVADLRKSIKDNGVKKAPGLSSIEVNGLTHDFVMGDCSHCKTKEIYEKLDEMNKKLKQVGYVANTSSVLLNVDEEEKETALTYHSEKIAMAFGLISTAPNSPIRIVKNLRVCDDCHSATKLLSKIYNRLIIVRDRNRFHHFTEGLCSCGDYW